MTPASRATIREFVCRADPLCRRTCQACRKRWQRTRDFHRSVTDEEFEACKAWLIGQAERPHYGKMRRYVHETLRRANAPYSSDRLRIEVPVSPDEHERIKRLAAEEGLTLRAWARRALGLTDGGNDDD